MMKKIKTSFVLGLLFILYSCGDNNELQQSSKFNIYGLDYKVSSAICYEEMAVPIIKRDSIDYEGKFHCTKFDEVIEEWKDTLEYRTRKICEAINTDQFVYKNTLSLYSDGITWDQERNKAVGKGRVITLSLFSDQEGFVEGDYTFGDENKPGTCNGHCSLDYDLNQNLGACVAINKGNLKIEKVNEDYKITVDGITFYNQNIKIEYKGHIAMESGKESSLLIHKNVNLINSRDTVLYFVDYPDLKWRENLCDMMNVCIMNLDNGATFGIPYGFYYMSRESELEIDVMYCSGHSFENIPNTFCFLSPEKIMEMAEPYASGYQDDDYMINQRTQICHDPAAAGINFTNADFDALTPADADVFNDIPIISDFKKIEWDGQPRIILFQTFRGIKGAIRVKKFIPNRREVLHYHRIATGGHADRLTTIAGEIVFDVAIQCSSLSTKIK